jgi:hypothetical protein
VLFDHAGADAHAAGYRSVAQPIEPVKHECLPAPRRQSPDRIERNREPLLTRQYAFGIRGLSRLVFEIPCAAKKRRFARARPLSVNEQVARYAQQESDGSLNRVWLLHSEHANTGVLSHVLSLDIELCPNPAKPGSHLGVSICQRMAALRFFFFQGGSLSPVCRAIRRHFYRVRQGIFLEIFFGAK